MTYIEQFFVYSVETLNHVIGASLLELPAIIRKIFETNSSFHVKYRTMGKVQFLFFKRFLRVLTRFLFREEDTSTSF